MLQRMKTAGLASWKKIDFILHSSSSFLLLSFPFELFVSKNKDLERNGEVDHCLHVHGELRQGTSCSSSSSWFFPSVSGHSPLKLALILQTKFICFLLLPLLFPIRKISTILIHSPWREEEREVKEHLFSTSFSSIWCENEKRFFKKRGNLQVDAERDRRRWLTLWGQSSLFWTHLLVGVYRSDVLGAIPHHRTLDFVITFV